MPQKSIKNHPVHPGAIIMGGSVNGLSFARSLGRRRVPVLLLESERLIGTYTRYAETFLLPPVEEHPDQWIDYLEGLASNYSAPPVLIPTSDPHVLFISRYEERLGHHFRFLVPELQTIERILDKKIQFQIANSLEVPLPITHFPENPDEVHEISKKLSFPCILKPRTSHIGRKIIGDKVFIVNSPDQLIAEYLRLTSVGVEFMIQEIIPGGDDTLYGYLGFWDGQEIEGAWITKRKLRQNKPYGDGSFQVTVQVSEIAELSRKILQKLKYRGFVGIEFRFDARDGRYKLIEINPRTVSGNQLAISAGVDFPWIGFQYLTQTIKAHQDRPLFKIGTRYVNEEWDLKAYLHLRSNGKISFREWVSSIRGAEAWAIGAWDDPAPLLIILWRLAKAAVVRKQ